MIPGAYPASAMHKFMAVVSACFPEAPAVCARASHTRRAFSETILATNKTIRESRDLMARADKLLGKARMDGCVVSEWGHDRPREEPSHL